MGLIVPDCADGEVAAGGAESRRLLRSGNQWQSAAVSGNQWLSMAISRIGSCGVALACRSSTVLSQPVIAIPAARALLSLRTEHVPLPLLSTEEDALIKRQSECVVCMDAPRQMFFGPCGHVATCKVCAAQVACCPMCKCAIKSRMRCYNA